MGLVGPHHQSGQQCLDHFGGGSAIGSNGGVWVASSLSLEGGSSDYSYLSLEVASELEESMVLGSMLLALVPMTKPLLSQPCIRLGT